MDKKKSNLFTSSSPIISANMGYPPPVDGNIPLIEMDKGYIKPGVFEGHPQFEFKCPYCGNSLSFFDFITSSIKYGLILLNNDTHCWFGCICYYCKNNSTVVKRFSKNDIPKELSDLYLAISKREFWSLKNLLETYNINDSNKITDGTDYLIGGSGKWTYDSFPYNSEQRASFCLIKEVDSYGSDIASSDASLAYRGGGQLNQKYCSYLFLPGAQIKSTAIKILWFNEFDIENIARIETQERKKIFPRYNLDSNIDLDCQKFCWDYLLKWQVRHRDASYKIDRLNENFESYFILPKIFKFIELLDKLSHMDELTAYHMIKIWDNFQKKYIQEMLYIRADNFIDKFINCSLSTNSSIADSFEIAKQYIEELYDAIKFENKRKKAKQDDLQVWKSKAAEAEKLFKDVHIVSRNIEILKLKSWIGGFINLPPGYELKKPILLLGEHGTGKGQFAKAIHCTLQNVFKTTGPFIKKDLGSIPEKLLESELFGHTKGAFSGATENKKGAFEEAEGGTIFLDEIGNISLQLQQKLLAVLDDWEYHIVGTSKSKPVRAFVIIATNKDLEQMIKEGKFMPDLFIRIDKMTKEIPPLKRRRDDIEILCDHFLDSKNKILPEDKNLSFDSNFKKNLSELNYDWSGNVRELKNVIESIIDDKMLSGDHSPIEFSDIPKRIRSRQNENTGPKAVKKGRGAPQKFSDEDLVEAMKKHNSYQVAVAKELSSSTKTISVRWGEYKEKHNIKD